MRKAAAPLIILTLFALCKILCVTPAHAQDKLTVLELFTTTNCADCPPADQIFQEIAAITGNDIIGLGCHVTYFNNEDWNDSLSRPECDRRQKNYMAAETSPGIYTPQVIINGRHEMEGTDKNAVLTAIENAQDLPRIDINIGKEALTASLPEIAGTKDARLWLFAYGKTETIKIERGQNAGQTINYANPVKYMREIDYWSGEAITREILLSEMPRTENYAVIAQEAYTRTILAAGQTTNPAPQ